jgi:carboxypeptidase T
MNLKLKLLKLIAQILHLKTISMNRILSLIIAFCFIQLSQAQTYSKVKIFLFEHSLQELNTLDIAIDHGSLKKDAWFITDLSSHEITQLENAGFSYEILIEDVAKFYKERNLLAQAKIDKALPCVGNSFEIPLVQNYSNGSMGGFFTYQEMLNHLDSMRAKYPNLISDKLGISNFVSIENRPIYWLRISNNPTVEDTSKPQIMYTALHHAREPASMQQLIYYMWYVLENYDTNPELQYVVDNVEMYFVPCINPDGYIYNESTDPNGGGMHRKNRRNIGTSNKGVDLNRNYGYQFGGVGSSSNTNDDTYRGTAAFSEPETQAMKWFVENHNFQIALNYHSYADALLFPWGYENSFQCPDHNLFTNLTDFLVAENNYDNYQSSLLYEAAGDSDDWAYGDDSNKPKVFSMTPEIGGEDDGFWPAEANILGICRENVFQNYAAAKSLLDNFKLVDNSPTIFETANFTMPLALQRLGLQETSYTLNIQALDANISNVNNPIQLSALTFGAIQTASFSGDIDLSSVQNATITFLVSIQTDNYTYFDTLQKRIGDVQIVFEDLDADMLAWVSTDTWGKDNDAYSAPTSTSDSPSGNYSNNQNSSLISNVIDLRNSSFALAEFYAKWDLEKGYDYVQISAAPNGSSNWTPLCGNYTVLGSENQDENQPLYDGVKNTWVKESISLEDYIGQEIQLRFQLRSDAFTRGAGFFFDDFKVLSLNDSTQTNIKNLENNLFEIYPNPSNSSFYVQTNSIQNTIIEVVNLLGQVEFTANIENNKTQVSTENLVEGSYFIYLKVNQEIVDIQRLMIMK